jgi:hypothetical protein
MVLLPLMPGCGTFLNLGRYHGIVVLDGTPTEKIFGGVRRDLGLLQPYPTPPEPKRAGVLRACEVVLCACCLAVELPLSAVGDTLTLPLVLPYALKEGDDFRRPTRAEVLPSSLLFPREGGADGRWGSEAERPAAPVPGGARLPSQP